MSAAEFGSVHIAFENEDVTVSSNDLQLIATIRTIFGPAVISEAHRSIGFINVIHATETRGHPVSLSGEATYPRLFPETATEVRNNTKPFSGET